MTLLYSFHIGFGCSLSRWKLKVHGAHPHTVTRQLRYAHLRKNRNPQLTPTPRVHFHDILSYHILHLALLESVERGTLLCTCRFILFNCSLYGCSGIVKWRFGGVIPL